MTNNLKKTPFGLHISLIFRTFILLKMSEKDGIRTGNHSSAGGGD